MTQNKPVIDRSNPEEEINGVTWAVGKDTAKKNVIMYACASGDYTYNFSFSTEYPSDFEFSDFARAFAETVELVK